MKQWRLRRLLLAIWVTLDGLANAEEVRYSVEHAFGNEIFFGTGLIRGTFIPKAGSSNLQLVRQRLSPEQQERLDRTAREGGYYKLRIYRGPHQYSSQTAIPARCLSSEGGGERLSVMLDENGELLSMSYDLAKMNCDPADTSMSGTAKLAIVQDLDVLLPEAAPVVQKEPVVPEVKRSAKSVSTGGSSGGHTAKKEGGASGGKDEAEPEVKDERTWLQKNWIYLIPAVFMMMNGFGGAGVGQRQAAPAQGATRQRARQ